MGLIEEIDRMDLADDVKARLKQEHQAEIDKERSERVIAERRGRRQTVEEEVKELASLFSDKDGKEVKAPGLLKFVRRVYLSESAEQPGAVLLSDADMELSGDDATGATTKEDISVAGAVRKVFELLPRTQDGKLNLGDIARVEDNHGRPPAEEESPEDKSRGAKERLGTITGIPVQRSRKRYSGGRGLAVAGGDA